MILQSPPNYWFYNSIASICKDHLPKLLDSHRKKDLFFCDVHMCTYIYVGRHTFAWCEREEPHLKRTNGTNLSRCKYKAVKIYYSK